MLHPKISGRWLRELGPFGPVTVEYGEHGSDAASWEMDVRTSHPALRGNAPVVIFDGGFPVWAGTLLEPGVGSGTLSAIGLWHQAQQTPCLDAGGLPTTIPDVAIEQARLRGDISWAGGSFSASAWSAANGELSLAALLDGFCAEQGTRWSVSPSYVATHSVDPSTSKWVVPYAVSGRGLAMAEDTYYSHLVGLYYSAVDVTSAVTVGSAEAATVFGRRTTTVDLKDMGVITAARATAVLTGMLLKSGARMGWSEGLELSYGEIVNRGGVPATLSQIANGQAIDLSGILDTTRANLLRSNTTIISENVRYTDGSGAISITPAGFAPRNFADVFKVVAAEAAEA